jgi:ABC-type multidrug transport system ATPase subunit
MALGQPPNSPGGESSSESRAQSTHGSAQTFVEGQQQQHHSNGVDTNAALIQHDNKDDGGNDDSSENNSFHEMERRHSMVQQLARQYTHASGVDLQGEPNSLFGNNDPDSPLNPMSSKFNARTWAKTLAKYSTEQGSGFRRSGVAFRNLNVYGFGTETDFQKDVGNVWLSIPDLARQAFRKTGGRRRIDILRNLDGYVKSGEMLVVLGPPGSGCSTFLKSIAGETSGIYIDNETEFNYQGITAEEMHHQHRGEAIYTAEVDVHFPMLSVGDTLNFAAMARSPRTLPAGVSHDQFATHYRDVVMAMYGISHTINTRVGNEYIRGVSGGERKRVTIAEATLSNAPFQCWDNSTRGLDSANAIEFCKTLRLQSDTFGQTSAVSIYQAPQSAYDVFDKVLVLYEGRQIFFGPTDKAKDYFINLGFECPARQTTPDFLTSMTAPTERIVQPGWESRAPRTPDEFATCWKNSKAYKSVQADLERYNKEHPIGGADAEAFREHKKLTQAKNQRVRSPYTLSYAQQVKLCLWRGWRRLIGDPSLTVFALLANSTMAIIISSLFYNLQPTTGSFYGRAAALYVAILSNAFSSALEILTQYSQRPIVEKHQRYGFYLPSAEAFSSVLCDMPYKIGNTLCYNLILYFMAHLNRTPGAFFYFLFVSFLMVLAMSGIFRSM